ncbi:unnamed protein product [Arabis nemorensis]|uniref:Gnk2-homologous domain-containing protein n=1 Tax=Arabis nemorensis TaxID=586526 RepID=A0A565B3B6_9BRAS|nr:unnamed protein product [Arabis nemorensis]
MFSRSSPFKTNRETLLSSFRDRSSLETYSSDTIGLSPYTVYGMFLCRGDITKPSCSDCVNDATREIAKNCTYQKEAVVFYEECMVRYSDSSFSTLMDDYPFIIRNSETFVPNPGRFGETLSNKMDDLTIKASSSPSYFLEDKERVTQPEGSYDLDSIAQCSPDLDPKNCTVCLKLAFQKTLKFSRSRNWALTFTPKCLLRYETSPSSSPLAPPPSPPRQRNGSSSINVIKGNEIFWRIFIAVMATYSCVSTFG